MSVPNLRPSRAMLLLALMTSACAAVPDLGPLPVSKAPALQAAALQSLSGSQAAWPTEGWWQRYRDPQLVGLIEEALSGSPDLDIAAARVRVAEGLAGQARSALLPSVAASASAGAARFSKNNGIPAEIVPGGWNETGSVSVGLGFEIDLWGRNRAALRAARLDAAAARYDAAQTRLALSTGVASVYADLAALHAQRDTLADALDIREQTLRLVIQRTAEGLDTEANYRQARGRLEQTEADIAATDEAIGLARNALAALVGSGPDRARAIARPAIAALDPQAVPADATIDLIGRRPDIAAARTRAEAAAERIHVARADFYPRVNLGALIGVQALGFDNLFQSDSTFGSAGPAVSLPIFQGGALRGQYRASRGQHDEAIARYDAQVIAALRETADTLTSQKMLDTRLGASRRALAEFEQSNALARLRYGSGLSTYLDVLAAEEGVLDARLAVARLETRAFALDIALIRALGGGFQA